MEIFVVMKYFSIFIVVVVIQIYGIKCHRAMCTCMTSVNFLVLLLYLHNLTNYVRYNTGPYEDDSSQIELQIQCSHHQNHS